MAALAFTQPGFPRFWLVADTVVAVLIFLNLLLIVAVHGRRIRQFVRTRREKAFQAQIEQVLAELDPSTRSQDPDWLRRHVSHFNELERPLAAVALIGHLQLASDDAREHALEVMRSCGAIDLLVRSTSRWMPWRRALAIRTLGFLGASEAVPLLLERARSDRSRGVREASVRALGRIGDQRAMPLLTELFRAPGRVGAGVVYDALLTFGDDVESVFSGALRSEIASVRVASAYGIAAVADAQTVRREIEPLLSDTHAPARAAAAAALGHAGGRTLPEALARATRDHVPAVRKAATIALASYDDPHAVELAVNALLDPDRDIAIRAGESLIRLRRRPATREGADRALLDEAATWPIERALVFDSLGVI